MFGSINNKGASSLKLEKNFTDPSTPHDRVIVVEGKNFYVYSGHLSFCSEFFRTMFESNFKEKNQNELEIEELAADDFHLFLQTLVPGNTSVITGDNYLVVLACARRFLAYEVISMCEKFTIDQFDNLDKIEMLKMAFEYNWTELKNKVVEFLIPTQTTKNSCPRKCDAASYSDHRGIIFCDHCSSPFEKLKEMLDKTSFMVQNKEKLVTLPAEIRAILFDALLEMADQ